MATVTIDHPKKLSFLERMYVPEILRGMGVTSRQLQRNVLGKKDVVTQQYPEEKVPYPERFRGRHRLMRREDGQVRCVACMLCATACPANCIHIVAAAHEDPTIEKYPVSFEVDLLACVYCGFCEEACPTDAIRLDSGKHPLPSFSRDRQRIRKVQLLSEGALSIAKQGGEGS